MSLKNNYLLKKLLKWANKNVAISIFTMLYFFFGKNKEKNPGDITILHLWTKNPDDMIYSSWDTECDRMKLVIMENLLPCCLLPHPPKNLKNQNFKKCKKHAGEIIILHVCTKSHNHMSYNSWDMECNRHNYWPQKLKFGESVKKPWKCHDFKLVYQKSWSYAILFLRYSMWQIVIFHSGLFFALLFP